MDQYLKAKKSKKPMKQQLIIPYFEKGGVRRERAHDLSEWLNSELEVGSSGEVVNIEEIGRSEEGNNSEEVDSNNDATEHEDQQVRWTDIDECWGATWEKNG